MTPFGPYIEIASQEICPPRLIDWKNAMSGNDLPDPREAFYSHLPPYESERAPEGAAERKLANRDAPAVHPCALIPGTTRQDLAPQIGNQTRTRVGETGQIDKR
jgi:hypothetical protein